MRCSNKSFLEKQAIKSLRNDQQIVIAKADKGNTTVVLNREDLKSEVVYHLEGEQYYPGNIFSLCKLNLTKSFSKRRKNVFPPGKNTNSCIVAQQSPRSFIDL